MSKLPHCTTSLSHLNLTYLMRVNQCNHLIIVVTENLKLIHVYRAASCECIWDERQNPSYLSQSHSVTQIHVLQGPCADSHTL